MKSGFSLVEILIVIAVVGVIAGVGSLSYVNWRNNSVVSDAVRQITQDIERARSDAKRLNATRRFFASTGTSYQIRDGNDAVLNTRILPQGAQIAQVTQDTSSQTSISLSFAAPYGTQSTAAAWYDIVVRSVSNTNLTRTVRVIGPLGKVIVR